METQFTGDGKPYLLIGRENDETKFRITAHSGGYWSGEPEIRIARQIGSIPDRDAPSIPLSILGDFMKAIIELMPELTTGKK